MTHQPYDYSQRKGIRPISWNDFHGLCKALALASAPFQPQVILAVGRGGFYPGTLIAHLLQAEIYPVRLSRRVNDIVTYDTPRWLVHPPDIVAGQRVLIVDEISSTGETLQIVKAETERLGAAAVRCAVLYAHSWGLETPDYVGLLSDDLLLNPWDREIVRGGAMHFHPEYASALAEQGVTPSPELLIVTPNFTPAKAPR